MTELFFQELEARADRGELRKWRQAERRSRLLEFREEHPDSTLAELAEKVGVSVATIQQDLRALGIAPRRKREPGSPEPRKRRVDPSLPELPDDLRAKGAGWNVIPGGAELRKDPNWRIHMRRAALSELRRRFRATQKDLARSLGVSLPTIAADLRALRDEESSENGGPHHEDAAE